MKKILITILITLLSVAAYAETMNLRTNEWKSISIDIPAGKTGGGDFYVVALKPENTPAEYKETDNGVDIKFNTAGSYNVTIVVNHITKSSCGGVKALPYNKTEVLFNVAD